MAFVATSLQHTEQSHDQTSGWSWVSHMSSGGGLRSGEGLPQPMKFITINVVQKMHLLECFLSAYFDVESLILLSLNQRNQELLI